MVDHTNTDSPPFLVEADPAVQQCIEVVKLWQEHQRREDAIGERFVTAQVRPVSEYDRALETAATLAATKMSYIMAIVSVSVSEKDK